MVHVIGLVLTVDVHPLVATPEQPQGELTHLTVCQLAGNNLQGEKQLRAKFSRVNCLQSMTQSQSERLAQTIFSQNRC